MPLGVLTGIGRMIGFEVTPEHVLKPVGYIENADDGTTPCFPESVKKHSLALLMNGIRLIEERLFIQHTFVQSPGVLSQAQSTKMTLSSGEVHGIRHGM